KQKNSKTLKSYSKYKFEQKYEIKVPNAIYCIIKLKGEACKDLVASAGDSKIIKIWNFKNYQCIKELKGHRYPIHGLIQMNDMLISSDDRGNIFYWNISLGTCVKETKVCNDAIYRLEILNDTIAAAAENKVYLLNISNKTTTYLTV